jgi:outer membrane lipoprotein-sorting protein
MAFSLAIGMAGNALAALSAEERTQLESLLDKAESAGSYRATMTQVIEQAPEDAAQAPSRLTLKTTTWQQGEFWRMDSASAEAPKPETWIRRADGVYHRAAGSPTYLRYPGQASVQKPTPRLVLENPTLRLIGSGTVHGQGATIIEYSTPELGTSKVWLSNTTGLPLKQINEFPKTPERPSRQTVTTEWTDYTFGTIPEATFEIPPGQVQEASVERQP